MYCSALCNPHHSHLPFLCIIVAVVVMSCLCVSSLPVASREARPLSDMSVSSLPVASREARPLSDMSVSCSNSTAKSRTRRASFNRLSATSLHVVDNNGKQIFVRMRDNSITGEERKGKNENNASEYDWIYVTHHGSPDGDHGTVTLKSNKTDQFICRKERKRSKKAAAKPHRRKRRPKIITQDGRTSACVWRKQDIGRYKVKFYYKTNDGKQLWLSFNKKFRKLHLSKKARKRGKFFQSAGSKENHGSDNHGSAGNIKSKIGFNEFFNSRNNYWQRLIETARRHKKLSMKAHKRRSLPLRSTEITSS